MAPLCGGKSPVCPAAVRARPAESLPPECAAGGGKSLEGYTACSIYPFAQDAQHPGARKPPRRHWVAQFLIFRYREDHPLPNLPQSLRDVKGCTDPEVCSDVVRICECYMYFACIARIHLLMIQKSQRSISVQVTEANVGAVPRAHTRGASLFLYFEELHSGSNM